MAEAIAAFVVESFALEGVAATVASFVVETAVTSAIVSVASSVLGGNNNSDGGSSGLGGTAASQSLAATIRQAAASRRLIYGTAKAGGVLVYPAQNAANQDAWLDIYLCEGVIAGIDDVFWIGDELSSDAKFSGLYSLYKYLGAPGQTANAGLIAVSGGEWASSDVATGIAHAVVRYSFNRNAFPRGLVLPAFLVQGRVVYDPRTTGTAYSNNPALCLLDYIRSPFGPDGGVADGLIDFDSFAAAANVCDELVVSIDASNIVGGTPNRVRRYTFDGVLEVNAGHTQIVETILRSMAGRMPFTGGQYRLYAGAWRAPTGPVLTGDFLRGPASFRTHPGRQQRINTVRGTYREPRADWQDTDFAEQQLSAAVVAEDGEIVENVSYPCTTKGAIAQRLAKLQMMLARSAVPVSLPCNWAALVWQAYDVLTLDIPEAGLAGDYLVTSCTLAEEGGIDLVVTPHLASDFVWDHTTDETLVPTVTAPDFNKPPLPPAGLSVNGGSVLGLSEAYGLLATWTASADAFLAHYEHQYKESASGTWFGGVGVTTPQAQIPLPVGIEYDFRVRLVRDDGTASDWSTETNILVEGDTTPPAVPPSIIGSGTGSHTIEWLTPSDSDFSRVRVYASDINNPATGVEISEVFGFPSTWYSINHTPGVVPQYYWVTAVDRVGNETVKTAAYTGP